MTAPLLALVAVAYGTGLGLAWRRTGPGKVVGFGEAARFTFGWLALGGALLSPLSAAAGRSLAAHMVQHLLVVAVAAPLWASAGVGRALLCLLPLGTRRALAAGTLRTVPGAREALLSPLSATAIYVATLWLWHMPAAYLGALGHEVLHGAEHGAFLAAACLFWATVLPGPKGAHRRTAAHVALLGASFAIGGLGALMALSPRPWYPEYAALAAATGRDALSDQQLAGVLMWMPMGGVHAAAALAIAATWLRPRPGRRAAPASLQEARA